MKLTSRHLYLVLMVAAEIWLVFVALSMNHLIQTMPADEVRTLLVFCCTINLAATIGLLMAFVGKYEEALKIELDEIRSARVKK